MSRPPNAVALTDCQSEAERSTCGALSAVALSIPDLSCRFSCARKKNAMPEDINVADSLCGTGRLFQCRHLTTLKTFSRTVIHAPHTLRLSRTPNESLVELQALNDLPNVLSVLVFASTLGIRRCLRASKSSVELIVSHLDTRLECR